MEYITNKKYIVSGKDTDGFTYTNVEMIYLGNDDLIEESFLHFQTSFKKEIIFYSENVYKIVENN